MSNMYSFPKQFKGNCIHCNKEIYTFDNPEYDWLDHAAFVEMVDNDSCRIIGGYGSTTMDMSVAEFVDYDLFNKCVTKMNDEHCYSLYICDDCINELLKEGKIAFSEEFRQSPISMLIPEEHPNGYVDVSIHPNLRRKNIYVPIQKDVFAFKYNDGPEKLVEEMRKYYTFAREDSPWTIDYYPESNRIWIENQKENILVEILEGEVLVVYGYEEDFDVLPERLFNKRFRFAM